MNMKIAVFAASTFVTLLLLLQFVPEAEAVLGRRAVRTAVVVSSASKANQAEQEAAAAKQEAAAAKAEADAANQRAAAAQTAAPPPGSAGPLPAGRVVSALPGGCSTTIINGVEYHHCGVDYYRAAFHGSQLVYVTARP